MQSLEETKKIMSKVCKHVGNCIKEIRKDGIEDQDTVIALLQFGLMLAKDLRKPHQPSANELCKMLLNECYEIKGLEKYI